MNTRSESIEEIMRGSGYCSQDLWSAWRTRDYRSAWCSDNWWGRGLRGGASKREYRVFPGRPQSFRYQRRPEWTTAAQDEGEWRKTAEEGAERVMAKGTAAEKVRAGLRHVVVCPNVTGGTKERIAQSKHVRAGSLGITD